MLRAFNVDCGRQMSHVLVVAESLACAILAKKSLYGYF